MMVYVPTMLDGVAVVVSPGEPLTTALVSPFTKPLYEAVKVGFASPKFRDALLAVTVSVAAFTVCVTVLDVEPPYVLSPP